LAILFNQSNINNDIIKYKIVIIIETPVADEYLFKIGGGFVKLLEIGIIKNSVFYKNRNNLFFQKNKY
jgi:hypothetical protein